MSPEERQQTGENWNSEHSKGWSGGGQGSSGGGGGSSGGGRGRR
jgi:hypothetical protein